MVDNKLSDFRRTVRLFRRFGVTHKVYVLGVLLLIFEALTSVIALAPAECTFQFHSATPPC
jgi:hypothetical protein